MSGSGRFQNLTILPLLPGTIAGEVLGVSNGAAVVCGRNGGDNAFATSSYPTRWANGRVGSLAVAAGNTVPLASEISADGRTITGAEVSTSGAGVWTGDGYNGQPLTQLSLFAGDVNANALGIAANAANIVCGYSFNTPNHGVLWTGGTPASLPNLPLGNNGQAVALSADGSVTVGGCDDSLGTTWAVKWVGGVITNLGALSGDNTSGATDASNLGAVIVGTSNDQFGNIHAAVWEAGQVFALPPLPGNRSSTQALSVSSDGSVISGLAGDLLFLTVAPVVWINGAVQRLPTLGSLGSLNGALFSGQATDVSPDGAAIGGFVMNAAGMSIPCLWT